MANAMMKLRGIVSIALFLMLALAFVTGLEGDESEGDGFGGGQIHVASAVALGILAIIHILLNQRMLVCQIKALLGIKNKPKNEC